MTPQRGELLQHLAETLFYLPTEGCLRVAIDGVDGAGKTVLGDELAGLLKPLGRQVIRASVDDFHHPQHLRYQRGATSPEGFFRDSYNYPALVKSLLEPLGPGGSRCFYRHVFDHRTDRPTVPVAEFASADAILILDGIFLHRPELRHYWDFSIFLAVDFSVSIPRCAQRDAGSPDPLAPENRRYVEGQKLYLAECRPWTSASVVINNADLAHPYLVS
ncbi:MAG: uridine kinase [Candidatus Sericytochromatia bacterium]